MTWLTLSKKRIMHMSPSQRHPSNKSLSGRKAKQSCRRCSTGKQVSGLAPQLFAPRGFFMPELTADRAREILSYDPISGVLMWRLSRGGKPQGSPAGCVDTRGCLRTRVDRKLYLNHRLIWLLVNGSWPSRDIDHLNGDPADNRLENMRDVSNKTNHENKRRPNSNNSCGCLGVYWAPNANKYRARIRVSGKSIHIGYFESRESAYSAYLTAKRRLHAGCTI